MEQDLFGALSDDSDDGALNKSGTSGADGGLGLGDDESDDSDNDELIDALGGPDETIDDDDAPIPGVRTNLLLFACALGYVTCFISFALQD